MFDDEGYLWISSGDRQKFTPAQDMQTNLGKVLRLHDDGSVPNDNPFVDYFDVNPLVDDEGVYGQIWSLGHRNVLGLALDLEGQLWDIEMGPRGGDELNLVKRAANHGYPIVSEGDHYDGREIPDHDTLPEFEKPAVSWNPVISPGGLMIYRGDLFSDWRGDAFAAGLSSQAIVRVELDGVDAREVDRYDMGCANSQHRRGTRRCHLGPGGRRGRKYRAPAQTHTEELKPGTTTIANFFMGLNKPLSPTRMFTGEGEALAWLRQHSDA